MILTRPFAKVFVKSRCDKDSIDSEGRTLDVQKGPKVITTIMSTLPWGEEPL